jgi:hypothetical protein
MPPGHTRENGSKCLPFYSWQELMWAPFGYLQDALKAGKAVLQPAPTAHYVGRSDCEVLDLVVQRVATAAGLPVELRGPSGCRQALFHLVLLPHSYDSFPLLGSSML